MDAPKVVRDFHEYYWGPWPANEGPYLKWMGRPCLKNPMDLWMYQEIIYETQPDLVIETGTWSGGSALFLATVCESVNRGLVISVDLEDNPLRPRHPRLIYAIGNSGDAEQMGKLVPPNKPLAVMAILDSDHRKAHVEKELAIFADIVSVGNYLIVEDTNLNGNPVSPEHGPGPREAVEEFLAKDKRYQRDSSRERLILTYNPGGFLKRIC